MAEDTQVAGENQEGEGQEAVDVLLPAERAAVILLLLGEVVMADQR